MDKDAALSRVEPAPQRAPVADALDLQIEGRRGGAVRHGIDAVGAGYAPGSLPDSYYRRDLDHNNPSTTPAFPAPAISRSCARCRRTPRTVKVLAVAAGEYWTRPQELFARAHAQDIAWRSGSRRMREELDSVLGWDQHRRQQWPHNEFAPIAGAMDCWFEAAGWLVRED